MAQPQFQVDRTTALYERPAMDIVDAATFAEVKQAIASAFAAGQRGEVFEVGGARGGADPQTLRRC